MIEWLVELGSIEGLAEDESALVRFHDALAGDAVAPAAAASLDTSTGALAFALAVRAESAADAIRVAADVFGRAVLAAGLSQSAHATPLVASASVEVVATPKGIAAYTTGYSSSSRS